jgi:phosphoglycerate dehydrogenase-like enzyme
MAELGVFILHPPDDEAVRVLGEHLDTQINVSLGPDLPEPAEYHVLVAGRPGREHLVASPNLHTLIIPFAGLPDVTREVLRDFSHLAVHNLHHNAPLAAELALALLLAAAKLVVPFDRAFREHDWTRRYQPNPSLYLRGKTALILGYGQIGQRVGIALGALGMNVVAVRRDPTAPLMDGAPRQVYPLQVLSALLPKAHVLVVALPLTDETHGLLGEVELASMPRDAVLVNVGRGAVIDQRALYHALREGHLLAAGLDVWYNYPQTQEDRLCLPPADYPFHELDNVVMSPHRGGHVKETEAMRMKGLATSLNAAARGEPIPNPVDLCAGY